jgi:hypothetical protein
VAAAKEFIRKCENGEARSVRSYSEFKSALKTIEEMQKDRES